MWIPVKKLMEFIIFFYSLEYILITFQGFLISSESDSWKERGLYTKNDGSISLKLK